MSYYIKQTYPELDTNKPSKIFHGWLGDYKVDDNYNNWTFSGNYYIFANAYLPNYAFYLDFQTFFASIKNINLNWKKTIVDKKLSNNNPAYSINEYSFSFEVPTTDSSYFKEYLINTNINLKFNPVFNQKIMNDFKIEVDQNILNSWINEINKTTNYSNFLYSNYFDLDQGFNKLNFGIANDISANLEINIPNFMSQNAPINNLMTIVKFKKNTFLVKDMKIKIKYKVGTQSIKELALNIAPSIWNDDQMTLGINKNFSFENDNFTLNEVIEGYKGIYFPVSTIGIIDVLMNVEYMSKIKTIHFDRQFSFDDNIGELCQEKILPKPDKTDEVYRNEVQSENIF